jgi:two-component system, LuxR family, response regulator FixJ
VTSQATVYVIDDDASVRRALGRLLNVSDYAVVLCESAAAFLSLRTVERPCCLVVDVRMPGLTGFDLQESLNAEDRRLPIVFITGHGDATMAARALASGAKAFLSKPVDDGPLLEAVRAAVRLDCERLAAEANAKGS